MTFGKMSGPSSISRRIESCIASQGARAYEEALIHYFPALDKTAKRRRPNAGVGDRIRGFLRDEEDLISAISIRNMFKGLVVDGIGFPEAIYKFGRTAIAHEGELDPRLRITDDDRFAIGATWQLPASYLAGLTVAVVVAPENKGERIGKEITVRFLDTNHQVDALWGKEVMVRQIIHSKFSRAI
jgi:hypothetical protein